MVWDPHPQLLRAFRAVMELGSFTAAAEQLGYTQSALSKQVQTLERSAGVALFDRGPRGVRPTPAAWQLAPRAASVLDQLDAAEHDLTDLPTPPRGRVALGGFPAAAMALVPRAIAAVRRSHPDIDVDFTESSTPVQLRRLRAGRLDLAVIATGGGLADYDLDGIVLDRLSAGLPRVAVSEHHRLAHLDTVTVDDLVDEPWVVGRASRTDPQFGAWPSLREPRIVAELGEWSTRLGFVAAGLGITTLPALAVASAPPGVVVLRVDDPTWSGRSLGIAHRDGIDAAANVVSHVLRTEISSLLS